MRLNFLFRYILLLSIFMCTTINYIFSQTYQLETMSHVSNNNGSGTVTFNFQNTNNYDVIIQGVEGFVGSSGQNTATVYYKVTPINGAPGAISAANGWVLAGTNNFNAVGNTNSTLNPDVFFTNLGLLIPANTTYGIAVHATGQRYSSSLSTALVVSNGGCNMLLGPNISYGGGDPPASPTNSPRYWIGRLTVENPTPCVTPPTAGTATVPSIYVCDSTQNIPLSLIGNSLGMGQTYEWESSSSNSPYSWTSVAPASGTSSLNTTINETTWFRCKVTCSTQTAYSSIIQVNFGTPLAGGVYTINPSGSGPNNFVSLESFVQTLNTCGISGPIVANVSPTLTTNNRIQFENIPGASATNTIRINGNGSTIKYNGTSTLMSTVELNGTQYLTLDSFNIISSNATYGVGVHIWNNANFDSIINCYFDLTAVTSSSSYSGGIVLSNSRTSISSTGNNGKNLYIGNNKIEGSSTANYGMYAGINMYGSSTTSHENIIIENNEISNFYYYGLNLRNGTNIKIHNNKIHKTNKTIANYTTYAIYTGSNMPKLSITNNKIHNLHGNLSTYSNLCYLIYVGSSGTTAALPLIISNNALYNNNMPFQGIYVTSSNVGLQISHNTIDGSLRTYSSTNTTYGIYSFGSSGEIKNNIINMPNSVGNTIYGIYSGSSMLSGGVNGNVINLANPAGIAYAYYYSSTAYTTLANFRAAQPTMETLGLTAEPYYTNLATGNLLPTNTSLYRRGAVTNPSITQDIDGINRFVANPTPGAVEMVNLPNQIGIELSSLVLKDLTCITSDSLKIQVTNQSNVPLISFRAQVYLNGVAQTPQTITTNLGIGATNTYYLTTLTLPTNGFTQVSVKIDLPNNSVNQFAGIDSLAGKQGMGMAGVYTVNAAAPTAGTNFNNIKDLEDNLTIRGLCSAVVVNFVANSGPYNGSLNLISIKGLSTTNTLTINGNNNSIEYAGTVSAPHNLVISNSSNISINDLTFKATNASYGWGALIMSNSSNINLKRNVFDLSLVTTSSSTYSNGITISNSFTSYSSNVANVNNILIDSNQILGTTGNYGMYVGIGTSSGATNVTISRNILTNFYIYGMYIQSNSTTTTDNIINRSTKTIVSNTIYGYYGINGGNGNRIERNRIFDLGGASGTSSSSFYPIYLATHNGTTTAPCIVANNVIYGNKSNAAQYGFYSSSSSNIKVLHNTIVLDQPNTSSNANYGMYFSGSHNNLEFKNNLISITAGGSGNFYGYYFSSAPTATGVQRNNVHINIPNRTTNIYHSYWGGNRATLAALQAAYPTAEVGSLETDPMFINIPYGNFTIQNISPLTNNGANLTTLVPTDILGTTRSTTPTVGAYEVADPINNDAKTLGINGDLCRGTHPISVKIANNGANVIDSVRINWSINGVMQPTYYYTTPIVTQLMSNTAYIHDVVIGNATLSGATTFKFWTSHPNGVNDGNPINDTTVVVQNPRLSGNVTINSAIATGGTNYQSFKDLTDELEVLGLCGPLVVDVAPYSGPYEELVTFNNYNGSSDINTITINGNNQVIQFNNTTSRYPVVHFNGAKYIKLDNIQIKALNVTYGWGVLFNNGAQYDSLTNSTIDLTNMTTSTSSYSVGLAFSSSLTSPTSSTTNMARNIFIGNNVFAGNPNNMYSMYYGLVINSGADTITVKNNEFKNFGYYGIYLTGTQYNNDIDGNEIHRAQKTSVTTFYGIYTNSATMYGLKIRNNRIHTPTGSSSSVSFTYYGMYLAGDGTATDPIQVYNNALYNINGGGSYGIYATGALYNNIYHNTISYDVPIAYGTTNNGMYFTGTHTGTQVKNNIISFTAGGTSTKYGYYLGTATSPDAADFQRNNVYMGSTQAGTQYHSYRGAARNTLADLQAAYSTTEIGSLSGNPYFVNSPAGNLKPTLQAGALRDNGLNLNTVAPTDIVDQIRPVAPTPGAFQMDEPLNNNAEMLAITDPSTFCPGSYEVKVTIGNAGLNTIDSVRIDWMVNGVLQPTVYHTSPIYSVLSNNTPTSSNISLGNAMFTGTQGVIKAWTSYPNGTIDLQTNNDTFEVTIASGLTGNYTINRNAPASATNFTSITNFITEAERLGICGPVVVDVVANSGPYTERVYIGNIPNSSAANTLRINGNGNTVQFAASTSEPHLLRLTGTKYTTIDNFVFKSTSSYGWAAHIWSGAEYDSITNNIFDLTTTTSTSSTYSNGITLSNSLTSPTTSGTAIANNIYIGNNEVRGSTANNGYYYASSIMQGADDIIFKNNRFIDFYYYGMYIGASVRNLTVDGNEFTRANKTGVTTFYGIYSTGNKLGNTIISNNKIHKAGGINGSTSTYYGIYFSSPNTTINDTLRIFNNILYNNNQGGTYYGIYVITGGVNVDILHNTVEFSSSISSTLYAIYISGTSANGRLMNNIVSLPPTGSNTAYGYYFGTTNGMPGANVQRNNVYLGSATPPTTFYYAYHGGNRATLAALQAAYPLMEVGSISVNPQFVNIANGNLSPTNAALYGNGVQANDIVETDIIGFPRPAAPTPGAFEKPLSNGRDGFVVDIIEPRVPFCPGVQTVKVDLMNYGNQPLSNFNIHWSINGVAQTPISYTGILDTFGGTGRMRDTVILGTANFGVGIYNLKAYIDIANDIDRNNDTLNLTLELPELMLKTKSDTVCLNSDVRIEMLPTSIPNGSITWFKTNGGVFSVIPNENDRNLITSVDENTQIYGSVSFGASMCNSDTLSLIVVDPAIINTVVQDLCGPGFANFSGIVNPGANIKWYENENDQTEVHTGLTFDKYIFRTDTVWAEGFFQTSGGSGGVDSFALPISFGLTTGTPHNMFTVTALNDDLEIKTLYTKVTNAVNALVNFDVYYRPNNYQLTPGANTSNAGWILLNSATNIPSAGGSDYTKIADNILLTIPATETYSFYIVPGANTTPQYATSAAGTLVGSNSDLELRAGHRGSSLFNLSTTGGMHVVKLVYEKGQPCVSTRVPVIVHVSPFPEVDLGADIITCVDEGHLEFLNARNPGNNYLWDNGYNGQVRVIDASGTYHVTVTNVYGCTASDTINVTLKYNPVVDLGNDTMVCNNVRLNLDAGNNGDSYIWNTGETTPQITTRFSGLHFVNVVGANGCIGTDSINITYGGTAPTNSGIWARNAGARTFQFSVLNPSSTTSYEWDFGDGSPIDRSASPIHTYPVNGNYVVRLKTSNQCGHLYDTTTVHIFSSTDLNEIATDWNLHLYPNPAKGKVSFNMDVDVKVQKVTILNSLGQVVLTATFEGNETPEIDISALGSAMYNVQIQTNKGLANRKLDVIK